MNAPLRNVAYTGRSRGRPRVCIIGGACTEGDAISASIAADCRTLLASGEFDPFLLTGKCEVDLPHAEVRGLKGLIHHPRFVDADIRLFHYGFYTELADACVIGGDRIKRIVRYHNITPPHFVDPSQRANLERGHRQIAAIAGVDEVWPISPFNGRSLAAMGFAVDLAKTLPMPFAPLTGRIDPRAKAGPIIIAFVGRIVPAKGVHVLLDAFDLLMARGYDDVELEIVGSTYIRGYASAIRERIERSGRKNARFLGKLSARQLARAYERASILAMPSFHEGFCVPVTEALQAGAIPVVSDTTALPETLNGLGRLAAVGDAASLADRLAEVIDDLRALRRDPQRTQLRLERGSLTPDAYQEAVSRYLDTFSPARLGAELIDRLRVMVGGSTGGFGAAR